MFVILGVGAAAHDQDQVVRYIGRHGWVMRLRRLRKNRGKTMGQLARNVGISVSELSVIETGSKVPQSKLVDWMAGYLNVAVEELTGELPPELIAHQAEVKAEVKAMYQQRHGRDTLLQMRAELLQRMMQGQVSNLDEVKAQDELLSWMDEKLDAIDTAEAQEMHRRFEASLLMPLDAGAKLDERIAAAVKALDAPE